GLQFQLSGTISKDMAATTYLNPQDPIGSLGRKLAGDPAAHWALNLVYEMPFLKRSHGIVKQVLAGWQANIIFNWQSGSFVNAPSGTFSTGVNPALRTANRATGAGSIPARSPLPARARIAPVRARLRHGSFNRPTRCERWGRCCLRSARDGGARATCRSS